jgi:hypothetical protein
MLELFKNEKNEIMSSVVGYIQENPSYIRKLNGEITKIDDNDDIKKKKEQAINVIRNANEYGFYSYNLSMRREKIYCLELYFNNNYYSEYLCIFNLWKTNPENCNIFNRINNAFKTAIEYYVGEVQTTIKGVFIPEDKSLHKRAPVEEDPKMLIWILELLWSTNLHVSCP